MSKTSSSRHSGLVPESMPPGAIFIAAPREMSERRFIDLIKRYLPKANLVLGISKEQYVVGFENQLQFKMLELKIVETVIDKVAKSSSPHKIHVLEYEQTKLTSVLENCDFSRVLLVNGSWKYAFHNLPAYKILTENKIPIKFISPFIDEDEAKAYEESHTPFIELPERGTLLSEQEMFEVADKASKQSYDYSFQIGVAMGKKHNGKYELVAAAFNRVIPYQSYALHHGNSRERHLSPPHDTNHYDTIHAEMEMVVDAGKRGIDLEGTTMFINVLPCPNCARTLSQTGIEEYVYRNDHSGGYAAELLKICGKKVRQMS